MWLWLNCSLIMIICVDFNADCDLQVDTYILYSAQIWIILWGYWWLCKIQFLTALHFFMTAWNDMDKNGFLSVSYSWQEVLTAALTGTGFGRLDVSRQGLPSGIVSCRPTIRKNRSFLSSCSYRLIPDGGPSGMYLLSVFMSFLTVFGRQEKTVIW